MKSTTLAVDVAKSVFQIAVSIHPGKVSESHRVSRGQFLPFFAERKPAVVVLEACGTAHHWGRQLTQLGHRVVLLPPRAVRPYVQRNKTDRADAQALLEAYRNKQILPVPVKSIDQQTLASMHRLRSAWMGDRIGRINMLRGLLREFGLFLPVGARRVVREVRALLRDGVVPELLRCLLADVCLEIETFEARIKAVEKQLRAIAAQLPVVKRLLSIPGIGLLTATALVAFVGDIQRFATGRHFASFLGLTPREHSSGLKRRLGGIHKCGDRYLRSLLVHGARSALAAAKRYKEPDQLRSWALKLEQHRGHNKATVALANKMARIVWAVWKRSTVFASRPPLAQAA